MSFRFTVAAVLALVGALMLVTGVADAEIHVECTDSMCVEQTNVDVLPKLQMSSIGVAATYAGLALAFGDLRWPRQLAH